MVNKNLLEPQEDLFQKSLHQEADFYKGIEKYEYRSPWSLAMGAFISMLVCLTALTLIFALVMEIMALTNGDDSLVNFLVGLPIVLLFFIPVAVIAFKLSRKIIKVFVKRDKFFKIKTILILIIPTAIFILPVIGFYIYMFYDNL